MDKIIKKVIKLLETKENSPSTSLKRKIHLEKIKRRVSSNNYMVSPKKVAKRIVQEATGQLLEPEEN